MIYFYIQNVILIWNIILIENIYFLLAIINKIHCYSYIFTITEKTLLDLNIPPMGGP